MCYISYYLFTRSVIINYFENTQIERQSLTVFFYKYHHFTKRLANVTPHIFFLFQMQALILTYYR